MAAMLAPIASVFEGQGGTPSAAVIVGHVERLARIRRTVPARDASPSPSHGHTPAELDTALRRLLTGVPGRGGQAPVQGRRGSDAYPTTNTVPRRRPATCRTYRPR